MTETRRMQTAAMPRIAAGDRSRYEESLLPSAPSRNKVAVSAATSSSRVSRLVTKCVYPLTIVSCRLTFSVSGGFVNTSKKTASHCPLHASVRRHRFDDVREHKLGCRLVQALHLREI